MGRSRAASLATTTRGRAGRPTPHALALVVSLLAALACLSLVPAADGLVVSSAPSSWRALAPSLARGRSRGERSARLARLREAVGHAAQVSPAATPAIAAAGAISGLVTSATTTNPIPGVAVCAFSAAEEILEGGEEQFSGGCEVTDSIGEYTIEGLQPGNYTVEFFPGFESELNFVAQFYNDASTRSEATPVHVDAGETRPGIDAALHEGATIAGRVTASGAPLQEIEVCALEPPDAFAQRCALTNAEGEYKIVGLASGSYDVEFAVAFQSTQNFAPQYYNGQASLATAKPVAVTEGSGASGIDASLASGAQIKGTVTSASSHVALADIEVCASTELSKDEFTLRCTVTGSAGTYDLTALGEGEHEIEFFSPTDEFMPQFGRDVFVVAGGETTGVDAALLVDFTRVLEPPRISGGPVEGQTLKVTHGTWSNEPASFKEGWFRCTSATETSSCRMASAGESYTLTAADVGDFMRVVETAENVGGLDPVSVSSPTARVVAAAPPPSGPPAMAASPAPVAHLSAAQLKSLLLGLLVPGGKAAKIREVLKHGGYTASLEAPAAGGLSVSWYLAPTGSHAASAKPVLVAAGHVNLAAAGPARLTIKLTAKGRSLLKHASKLKLTARGSLALHGRPAASEARPFTLRR
jgi:hypothetical protein